MGKGTTSGLVSIVMVMAVTGVYLSKHHPQIYKGKEEATPQRDLALEGPVIITLDEQSMDGSVLYNKIARSIQNLDDVDKENISISTSVSNTTEKIEVVAPQHNTVEERLNPVKSSSASVEHPPYNIIESEVGNDIVTERREKIKEVLSNSETLTLEQR